MSSNQEWYTINKAERIDTPQLIVYPDRVRENIQKLLGSINEISRLRPHVKTHKTIEGTQLLLEAGIRKFKCATIAEAEMLAMCTAPDVLLAYQPNGPKLQRFVNLIKKYPKTRFSCLTDNQVTAAEISSIAHANHMTIDVYIDLNVGMNRTGITPEKAADLFKICIGLTGIKVLGFHAYDGHIREKDLEKRFALCQISFAPVEELVRELEREGYADIILIMGGSPSFPFYAKQESVECSPGTFIFWDKGYEENLPEQNFQIAALLISRVVSILNDRTICLDLGYKSVAAENELEQRIRFVNTPPYHIIGQSEEHLVLELPENHQVAIGDLFYLAPVHICPTCALYQEAILVQNHQISGSWAILARDRKLTL